MIIKLNGVTLTNEPKGLKDATFKIVRDQNLQGQFVSDLTFLGDGYQILLAAAQSGSPCTEIDVEIEHCSFIFQGRILITDIEFNHKKCTATAAIEDNSWAARVENNFDVPVRFNSSLSVNRQPITPYTGETINFGGAIGTKRIFRLLPSLQYIVGYLTDGQCTITTDSFFTTNYLPNVYTITCVRAAGNPVGTVQFQHTNIYGGTETPNGTIASGVNTNDLYADRIAQILQDVQINEQIDGKRAYQVSRTGNVVTVRFFHQANLTLIDAGGTGTLTITQTQAASYGIQNVGFTNGAFLNDSTAAVEQMALSLADLLSMTDLYGLKRIYRGNTLEILRESLTYDSTPAATITDIGEVTQSFNQPIAAKAVNFSQANEQRAEGDAQRYLLVNQAGYSGLTCGEDTKSLRTIAKYAIGTDWVNNTEWNADDFWIFETSAGALVTYQLTALNIFTITNIGRLHFASGLHPFVAKNNVFGNPDGLVFANDQIAQTDAVKIRKQSNFMHPLTEAQINAIKADPKKAINFDGEVGYIAELEYSIKTGMTTFNLLTE